MVSPSSELNDKLNLITLVYKLIYNSNMNPDHSFSIDYNGFICVRKYEHDEWVVEWEEYDSLDGGKSVEVLELEVLEFTDPYVAAECFAELCYHKKKPGHFWLGKDKLKTFKKKWNSK